MLPSLSANASTVTPSTCALGTTEIWKHKCLQLTRHGLAVPCSQPKPFKVAHTISYERRLPSKSVICAAALNARCAEGQTQTVTRQSSTITIAPTQGKEKSPELDDGGTGLPPRDDGSGDERPPAMAMAAASSLIRRASSQLLRIPPPRPMVPSSSSSMENPFAAAAPAPCLPEFPLESDGSMDLMAVPKKKVSRYKKKLRNGPKALKPTPVIVRCKACGRVKLPHFYCCSGDRGVGSSSSSPT